MSTRTSKADRNLYSVSRDTIQLYAGTDRAATVGDTLFGTVITNPDLQDHSIPWDTFLKVCDLTAGISFVDLHVPQGQENTIDVNNQVQHCSFVGEYGRIGETGDQVITVKGGSHDLTFAGTIFSKGRNADVVVGAWSDQSYFKSHDLDFSDLTRHDGEPVTFIISRADRKTIKLPPRAKVLFWKSLGYDAYWYAKRAAVGLGLFNGHK